MIMKFLFLIKVPSAYDKNGQTVYDEWMKVHVDSSTNEPK